MWWYPIGIAVGIEMCVNMCMCTCMYICVYICIVCSFVHICECLCVSILERKGQQSFLEKYRFLCLVQQKSANRIGSRCLVKQHFPVSSKAPFGPFCWRQRLKAFAKPPIICHHLNVSASSYTSRLIIISEVRNL